MTEIHRFLLPARPFVGGTDTDQPAVDSGLLWLRPSPFPYPYGTLLQRPANMSPFGEDQPGAGENGNRGSGE